MRSAVPDASASAAVSYREIKHLCADKLGCVLYIRAVGRSTCLWRSLLARPVVDGVHPRHRGVSPATGASGG